ncbi:MAG: hypothetical protein JKY48_03160 [Flavobacteriales bacterium]|nr:hypothetical protein [Flavobacteriales bacterium]
MSDRENREQLKKQFKNGDRPSEEAFAALIDGALNQASDKIFATDHKIGIGTKKPRVPLEVQGDSDSTGQQSFIASDGTNSTFRIAHPRKNVIAIGGNKEDCLEFGKFKKDGAIFLPKMSLVNNGNVGIGLGTESPTEKLEVGGSIKVKDKILLGKGELELKDGKLILRIDGKRYIIKMDRELPIPIRPISTLLIVLIIFSLLLLILVFICIYFELLTS